jgi:hypothetical protein
VTETESEFKIESER